MKIMETNNWDTAALLLRHSPTPIFHSFPLMPNVMVVSTDPVERPVPDFTTLLELDSCNNSPDPPVPESTVSTVVSDQLTNGWIAYVKQEFYSFPEMETIFVAIDENNVDFWLIIPKRNFTLVRQLIDREMKILDDFAAIGWLNLLEFHIVYRCGADESQFVPRRAIRLPR